MQLSQPKYSAERTLPSGPGATQQGSCEALLAVRRLIWQPCPPHTAAPARGLSCRVWKTTHLVFQSSSDLDLFLRAALCFSSSRFFSSLAWSEIRTSMANSYSYCTRRECRHSTKHNFAEKCHPNGPAWHPWYKKANTAVKHQVGIFIHTS